MRIAQEEIFGPVVSVMRCRSLDEAIEIGNGVELRSVRVDLHAGHQHAHSAPCATCTPASSTSTPPPSALRCTCRFGGTKATGNGHREAGTAALDVFSEWKSIYVDFSGKLQRAQIDTEEL